MMPMILEDPELFRESLIDCKGLKIADCQISIKDFLLWKVTRMLELSSAAKASKAWQDFEFFIKKMSCDKPFDKSTARNLLNQIECRESHPYRKVSPLLRKYHDRCEKIIRVICALNEERAVTSEKRRQEKITALSATLNRVLSGKKKENLELRLEKVFEGYNRRYRRFFQWKRQGSHICGYQLDQKALEKEKKSDGVFMLTTSRDDLSPETVIKEYKRLQEVESLFDDLKHFVDIHPVRHWLEHRVRAHVFLCILALLLKRILEIDCLGHSAVTEPLETVAKSKLVNYKVKMSKKSDAAKTFWKVTTVTPQQQRWFNLVGIRNPANLEDYLWWRKRKH
jgi:hypothetical protein